MDVRRHATSLLARVVANASDAQIGRWFGSAAAQRALFAAMAWVFDSDAAAGFEGEIVYELTTSQHTEIWTVEIAGPRPRVRRGAAAAPTLTLRLTLADFIRMAAGSLDPVQTLLDGRADVEGDLEVAVRLPEMFGV